MDFFDYINPLKIFGEGQYTSFWRYLFATFLQGFWGRLFASITLILAFWFGVWRRQFILGATLFAIAVLITYGASILRLFGVIT